MKTPHPLPRLFSILLAAMLLSGLTLHAAPVQPAQADGFSLFEPPVFYSAGSAASDFALGDINLDGSLDIVSTDHLERRLGIFINQGDGTFTSSFMDGLGEWVIAIQLHDMDGDGDLDVVVADASIDAVVILSNDGSGTFPMQPPTPLTVGDFPNDVVVADFNRDGKPDIAAANLHGETVSVLLNAGDGTFLPQGEYLTDQGPAFLAVDDFNLDGNPDLAATNAGSTTVSVLMGKGDGTFLAKTDFVVGSAPSVVTAEDFDHDGVKDLAVANSLGDNVSILRGYGGGTFRPKVDFAVGVKPYGMTAGDFNRDGKIDLVTASFETDNLTLLLNQGRGVFAPAAYYPAGGTSSTVRSGDLDHDGKLDLVTENENGAIAVLINTSPDCGQDGSACYVTPTGTGDCSSWANACGLQTALAAALPGSEIWVAAGTYKPTDGTDRLASFHLKESVAVFGGFAGTETERSQRDWEKNVTILSAEIGESYREDDNSCHIVNATNVSRNTVLDGFRIEKSNCFGFTVPMNYGGGVRNYQNASPTLKNLIIANNSAGRGGGMYNGQYSSPTLEHVYFLNNKSDIGGGMMNEGFSSPAVTDSLFQGNMAAQGGGILNEKNSNSLLVRVKFASNISYDYGGGIRNSQSLITLIDVVFEKNKTYSAGGGIDNCGSMVLQNATFNKNTADEGGAISNRCGASGTVVNALFLDNEASDYGGAILNFGDQLTVTNSTFYGNHAGLGGSIDGYIRSTIDVRNSIVWNDSGTHRYTTFDHSIVQGIANDPDSGVYGDEAHTPVFISTANIDFRLAENSPGVDAGLNTWLPADTLDLDRDGDKAELLPLDGIGMNRVNGKAVDLGAYEAGYVIDMALSDIVPAFDEDTSQMLDVLANDPYGGVLTITKVTQGSMGSVTIQGNKVLYVPRANAFGMDTFTYTVSNGSGSTETETVYVTITPVNDNPNFSSFADTGIFEGSSYKKDFLISDVETGVNALQVSVQSSNKTLVPDANVTVTGSGFVRTLTITPTPGNTGLTTITVLVTDEDGGTSVKSFTLTVMAQEFRVLLPMIGQ